MRHINIDILIQKTTRRHRTVNNSTRRDSNLSLSLTKHLAANATVIPPRKVTRRDRLSLSLERPFIRDHRKSSQRRRDGGVGLARR